MEFGLVGLWLAVLLLLGGLARPISAWLLPQGDHEALAIPVALAVLGVVGHLVGHLAFGWPAVIAGIAAIGIGASLALADDEIELDRRQFIEAGAVFTGAFLVMIAIRALDPAAAPLPVAIGEKFLDLGLLQSLQRAPSLPPEDMWFAGQPIRYHYGGHLLTAMLATMTGTAGRFAYNLGLAAFYATLVTAAYGLAGSIAWPSDISRRTAAGVGAFFVGVAGNLDTIARLLVWGLPDGVATWLATGLGYDEAVLAWSPSRFFYFDASRIFPIDPTDPNAFAAATEFPLFAWLNGDLHAHMMSQPFMLLAAAILLAYWRAADSPRRRAILLFGALPPVVGFISVVNIWSFPSAGGLVFLAVAFAPGNPAVLLPPWIARRLGPRSHWLADEGRQLGLAALAAGLVLLLGILWVLPYWVGVVLVGPGRTIGFWGRWTGFGGLVRAHGAFLVVFGLYLAWTSARATAEPHRLWAGALALFGVAILLGVPAIGFAVPIGLGAWWLLRRRGTVGFEAVFVLAGAGLVLLVELVTIDGDRFNTVFKYYAHVWLFWSVASGVALARLIADDRVAAIGSWHPQRGTIGRAVAALLIVSTGTYAGLALPVHVANPGPPVPAAGPTLDATGYLEVTYPAEAPAIRWLDERKGRPTIVTAAPGGYWWEPTRGDGSSAPASLTGLPTVLGWFHERQYRGPDPYEERLEHVTVIYTGRPGQQRDLLAHYDVQYIYVGPAERTRYSQITVDQLDIVTVAAEWEAVTIYRVDNSSE